MSADARVDPPNRGAATAPFVPAAELDHRLRRLSRQLAAECLDGALLHGTTNLLYFAGTAQQGHLWVPATGEPRLLIRRVLERARQDSALPSIEPLVSLSELPRHLGDARRVGMELDILPVSLFERYRKVMPAIEAVDIGPATRTLRAVKSTWEIERTRRAAVAADLAFREVVAGLRDGMTELELAVVAESAERRHGFQGLLRWRAVVGFECPWVHVLAGESALAFSFADTPFGGEGLTPAVPLGPGRRRIERGMPVCVDFAIACDGYLHDMTRTLAVGGLPELLVRAYDACRRVHDTFRAEARPGVTGGQVWQRCVELLEAAGFADHFMGWGPHRARFVGHGLGLELDEPPVLAPNQQRPLVSGNVVALEPKLFFPSVGAVGLESTYAITEDGVQMLTLTPEELVVVS